jgi:MEDS: MEthanogen/methylotroph, DcmR Sensory domain
MNANGAAILANPHPCGHIVYPYTDEGLVGQAVCLFASAGLRDGEGVVLIVSSDHWESIRVRLLMEGISAESYERSGQLSRVWAEDLLTEFMPSGVVDEGLFKSIIGRLIEKARASVSTGQSARVRIFGEMVSELRSKDLTATTRLEELWNEVIRDHSVSLLCTYALHHPDDDVPQALMQLHSQSIERESSVAGNK